MRTLKKENRWSHHQASTLTRNPKNCDLSQYILIINVWWFFKQKNVVLLLFFSSNTCQIILFTHRWGHQTRFQHTADYFKTNIKTLSDRQHRVGFNFSDQPASAYVSGTLTWRTHHLGPGFIPFEKESVCYLHAILVYLRQHLALHVTAWRAMWKSKICGWSSGYTPSKLAH